LKRFSNDWKALLWFSPTNTTSCYLWCQFVLGDIIERCKIEFLSFGEAEMKRVASIDIGTNTFLLLIAEVKKGDIEPLVEMETIVRLGEGLQKTGNLSPEAMRRGVAALADYGRRCQAMKVGRIIAVGRVP